VSSAKIEYEVADAGSDAATDPEGRVFGLRVWHVTARKGERIEKADVLIDARLFGMAKNPSAFVDHEIELAKSDLARQMRGK
jgi:hypothetical protein